MTDRTRAIIWNDPTVTANAVQTMTGLEFLTKIMNGELPPAPVANLLNMRPTEVESGRVVFCLDPAEYHYNPIGTVHGGVIATLLDSALACSIQTMLPMGSGYTTLELHINYIRPITVTTGTISAEGKIIHVGRRSATAEGRLTDAAGKLYAHATTTCIILSNE